MQSPRITTRRLQLETFVPEDAPALFAYRSDSEVQRYQGWAPESLDDAVRFIGELGSVEFDTPGTWFQLAMRLRESRQLVGDLGVHFRADDPRQVEFGVTVAPPHQGRGYGSEAVTALLDHVFGALGKHRVSASVDPRNPPSIALLERVGLRKEAHFRRSLWFRGEWADDLVYAVLAAEWRRNFPEADDEGS